MPLPGEWSDFRVALALGMTVQQFRRETTCRDYIWWVALMRDNQRRAEDAAAKANRGR